MKITEKTGGFWDAFKERDDLSKFSPNGLILFAMEMKFGIDDISTVASESLTDGCNDKKADLIHIDTDMQYAIIGQCYVCSKMDKNGAPANKASDLNTAISWLLLSPIDELPKSLQESAADLRRAIKEKSIRDLYLWYVHNLPESENVKRELKTVELAAQSAVNNISKETCAFSIQALEVGRQTLEEWYRSILTPILVTDDIDIPIIGGYETGNENWSAYATSVHVKWLYNLYKKYQTKLFSANVRDYLGSRNTDENINSGIKETALQEPGHFWVFNNGITGLVNDFNIVDQDSTKHIILKGLSIVNGAQTTGAIGSLEEPPKDVALVQIRFVKCNNQDSVQDIVRYNNRQNKITEPDFRSNDNIQKKLLKEFPVMDLQYSPRRGGHEDIIKRPTKVISSVIAGQVLAAFHGAPSTAYHQKTGLWQSEMLYGKYFNDNTCAKHIVFAYSLLKTIEGKKIVLIDKSNRSSPPLTSNEEEQLCFFRKRGSIFILIAAISKCLEIITDRPIPNVFILAFSPAIQDFKTAVNEWENIVNVASSFTEYLKPGLSDGFRNQAVVDSAINEFRRLMAATKAANSSIYSNFTAKLNFALPLRHTETGGPLDGV